MDVDEAIHERAITKAYQQMFERVLTEPLRTERLAEIFGVHRSKVAKILRRIPGHERCGTRWRVPLWRMPARYLQERDYLPRAS